MLSGEKSAIVQTLAKLNEIGIVELVPEKTKEINGLLGLPKKKNKQHLILGAWRATLHFMSPDGP